ncbi:hypothetical protein OROGR_021639 [Orobanche gracilis]
METLDFGLGYLPHTTTGKIEATPEPEYNKNFCLPYTTGKIEGTAATEYNKHFMGNIDSMVYVCKTSGSDWQRVDLLSEPIDYRHDIVLNKKEGGFTVNGGPFRRFDDPANCDFLDAIHYYEFPKELDPKVDATKLHRIAVRRTQKYKDQLKDLPHEDLPHFEAGTPKETLDAAVAKIPNSILIPLRSNSAGTRVKHYASMVAIIAYLRRKARRKKSRSPFRPPGGRPQPGAPRL